MLYQTWPGILAGGCDNSRSSPKLGCSLYTSTLSSTLFLTLFHHIFNPDTARAALAFP